MEINHYIEDMRKIPILERKKEILIKYYETLLTEIYNEIDTIKDSCIHIDEFGKSTLYKVVNDNDLIREDKEENEYVIALLYDLEVCPICNKIIGNIENNVNAYESIFKHGIGFTTSTGAKIESQYMEAPFGGSIVLNISVPTPVQYLNMEIIINPIEFL